MQSAAARPDGYDANEPDPRPDGAVSRFREAGRLYGATGDERALRDAVRLLAADAARRGLRAEELVIAFKQLWTTVPELSPLRRQPRAVMDELVTLCISEFYGRRGVGR